MARKKKYRPFDPAEAARKAYEQRQNPRMWGPNEEALTSLPQNEDVRSEAETRTKTRRITRFDCFALLRSRKALTADQDSAVRRLIELIEKRWRLEGVAPSERVDCLSGPGVPISDASLYALAEIEEILGRTGALSSRVLIALCEPQVTGGQPVNNWRKIVQSISGVTSEHGQVAVVVTAAENLREAFIWHDRGGATRKAA